MTGEDTTAHNTGHEWGKSLRREVPRTSHGDWEPAADRPDPVEVITSQNRSRLKWLVPVRHWRMAQSPFSFYRGAAKLMAQDLAGTPSTGIIAQICGDAHLSNFGVFASPERELVFDLNDFDETLPGPWEWDIKRLAASFAIAARHLGFDDRQQDLATEVGNAYRVHMSSFAKQRYLDAWYSLLNVDEFYDAFADQLGKKLTKRGRKRAEKARSKDSLRELRKLAEPVGDTYRIVAQPPYIVPFRDIPTVGGEEEARAIIDREFSAYRSSVPNSLATLLDRYTRVDGAMKVVGVGSVGTRCAILLLQGRDADDPLFLQVKEASRSVLEDHLPPSRYTNHGQRVVEGQQLMQAVSDSFLGWNQGSETGSHFYWRQLKDMKGSPNVDKATPESARLYTRICGWTLARAHARSGDAAAIAGYLGASDAFDRAMGEFAVAYADQNERDYAAFTAAIDSGRIEAHE